MSPKRGPAFRRHAGRPLRRPSSRIPTAREFVARMIDETWHLEPDWRMDERWAGIIRPYGPDDVVRLRGTIRIRHTLAERGAGRLWSLLNSQDYVPALGALTGNQAIQQVRAGLRAIYLRGWRLAADVMGVRTLIVARTDANSARLITGDADPADHSLISGERTTDGFFQFEGGLRAAIARGLAYAPYADVLWCETSSPDLEEAREFADAIHAHYPGKLLESNCSASFNWRTKLEPAGLAEFQRELGQLGYRFQFVTPAGFHTLNLSIFQLASSYAARGMTAYAQLQDEEFAARERGYRATEHQAFVGTEFFDAVSQVISGGTSSTLAMNGSTEREQIADANARVPVSTSS